jgi:NADH dehydrogenase
MQVIVTGGTGFVGSHLCRELAERGHEVTALSRDPGEADLPSDVETAMGDVTAYDSIADAFEGQEVAVNLVSLSPLYEPKGGNERHFEVHRDGTANVVRACEAHDVDHLVQMSGIGADPGASTAFLRAKGEAEELVRSSEPDWTIFRPAPIFGDGGEFVEFTRRLKRLFAPGVPVYPLPGGGETPFQPIWIGDVAPMMAEAVENEGGTHAGETYVLGGPEVLTLAEVARLAFRAEGKSVRIVSLPMALSKVGLTAGSAVPGFPLGPDQYRSLQMNHTTPDNDVGAFGFAEGDLLTLAEYLGVQR